jgi:hypothetical protein
MQPASPPTARSSPQQKQPAPQPKRNWLSEIQTKIEARPSSVIIYGVPGIGKTSLAAHVPGICFLCDDKEDGISTLKAAHLVPDVPQFPPISNWKDCLEVLDSLAMQEHHYRALAIDALGGFERLAHVATCERDFGGNWGESGFMGYMRGYEVALGDWRQFLNALDRLRDQRKMSIFLLGHAKIAPFNNPSGPNFDRYTIDMHHKTIALTHRWADAVLFANYDVSFSDPTKKSSKAFGGQSRLLYTEHTAAFDAKNRHNLPPEIDMGTTGADAWRNLANAIKQGRKKEAEQ